jgi:hypothetical protein
MGRRGSSSILAVESPQEAFHVLIAGLAKSGTTILFHRVREGMPGVGSTAFEPWSSEDLAEVLARRERTVTKILLGGPHFLHIAEPRRFDRKLMIVRDPRDRLVSEMLYRFYDFLVSGDREGFLEARGMLAAKVRDPASVSVTELDTQVSALAGKSLCPRQKLKRHSENALTFQRAVAPHVVAYEDLVTGDMEALEEYLGFPLARDAEVDERLQRVVRTRGAGDWRRWLTAEDLDLVHEWAEDFMSAFGYVPEDPAPVSTIPAAISLDYVDQFRPA